jgi:hypothetical protein
MRGTVFYGQGRLSCFHKIKIKSNHNNNERYGCYGT